MYRSIISFLTFYFCLIGQSNGALLTYPISIGCTGTLQACIDSAIAGDEIEITTETPIDESLIIDKSIHLYSATDMVATIGGGVSNRTISVTDGGAASTVVVLLESLSLNNTTVDILFSQGTGHDVILRDSYIYSDIASNTNIAVSVDLQVPSSALVYNNAISTTGEAIALVSSLALGEEASLVALANTLTASSFTNSASGIVVDLAGAGTALVNVHSNVVYSVTGCNCGAAGILVSAVNNVIADVNIINNTLDDMQQGTGIFVDEASVGSDVIANVFNNIVTRSADEGIFVNTLGGPVASLTVNNAYNNFYDNGVANDLNGYVFGAVTLSVNPEYLSISANNYRLHETSPLINAGTNSPNGALPLVDADSYLRVQNGVDMGAYEYALDSTATVADAGAMGFLLIPLLFLSLMRRYWLR